MNFQQAHAAYDPTLSGIKLVARPVRNTEPDLLAGRDLCPLVVKGPTGNVLAAFAATGAWTYETIQRRLSQDDVVSLLAGDCADAYVGDRWIGGTEI